MFDVPNFLEKIHSGERVALLAPSFPVDFEYPKIISDLRNLGFSKVTELTYAAKLINIHYHQTIEENEDKTYICSNCPSVVQYIKNKHPNHKDKLMPIASPMIIMSRFIKKQFGPETKTCFIGPCFAKKIEAQQTGEIDTALTFQELQEVLNYTKTNNISTTQQTIDSDFDSFYNDYTKVYPLTGAVAQTMHYKDILREDQVIICDGFKNIDEAIQQIENNPAIRFVDPLSCDGGCIGGPGIISKESTESKTKKIQDYKDSMKHNKDNPHLGKFEYAQGIETKNTYI